MSRQLWTREQDLAVLYLRIEQQGQLNQGHLAVRALAGSMNRTAASIWMRKCNFDSLDPSVPGVGLGRAAKLTIDIWAEFEQNPEQILYEARKAYFSFV